MRSAVLVAAIAILAAASRPVFAQGPVVLSPRSRIDVDLTPNAVHEYEIGVEAGHSVEITVTQRGIDVVVEVWNERDSLLFSVDSPNGRDGPEIVELSPPRAARYRLLVRPFDAREPSGRYTLAVTAWRDAAATREILMARRRARDSAASWLRSRSVPLTRLDGTPPRGALVPLDSLAMGATVIALGEATHASRELGDLRLLLTRYLIERHDFRLVAIEASANRLGVLNAYIQGTGDADSITNALETGWIGRRAQRELVTWLREWNQLHPGHPVHLIGLDPQENELARRDLGKFVALAYPQAAERYAAVERELAAADSQAAVFGDSRVDGTARAFLRESVGHMEIDLPAMLRLMDAELVRAGVQAAHLLLQFAEFNAVERDAWSRSRDWYMAVNLLAALDSIPGAKAVVWAHNAHVATPIDRSPSNQPMGTWLRAALGCRYRALGVTFGQGAFVAQIPNDLEDDLAVNYLPEAPDETVEGVLREVRQSGTLASWSCETISAAAPEWLREPQRMHWVGALFRPGTDPSEAFRPVRLLDDFDGTVFIPVVTADEMPSDRPLIPARRP